MRPQNSHSLGPRPFPKVRIWQNATEYLIQGSTHPIRNHIFYRVWKSQRSVHLAPYMYVYGSYESLSRTASLFFPLGRYETQKESQLWLQEVPRGVCDSPELYKTYFDNIGTAGRSNIGSTRTSNIGICNIGMVGKSNIGNTGIFNVGNIQTSNIGVQRHPIL